MKPVERGEILGLADYETIRPRFRARVIEEKRLRRATLGPNATVTFENRDTVLLQIQEMLRTERITREGGILHEMETYNKLVPGPRELSATVMIDIVEPSERGRFLDAAKGIEKAFAIVVDGERVAATWDASRVLPDRASAVTYLKFPLSPRAFEALLGSRATAELTVSHPAYEAAVQLSAETVQSLALDLRD
jgi:hypothetical protein